MNSPKLHVRLEVEANTQKASHPTLALVATSGSIWPSSPVAVTPKVELGDWRVFEVKLPGRVQRSRHFAGSTGRDGRGKASTAIVEFDPLTRRGLTESGRVYELQSSTGFNVNAEYVWRNWVRINRATHVVDVSPEIRALLEGQA